MNRRLVAPLPELDDGYVDQYGPIDHKVYAEAASLWPKLHRYAMKLTKDETQAWDLLVKTVARVSRRRSECGEIVNLRGYVLTVFRRLAVDEMRLARRLSVSVLDIEYEATIDSELDRSILVRQLFRRMDPFTRHVFELLICGFSFTEIVEQINNRDQSCNSLLEAYPTLRNVDAAVLRNKFRRRIIRLSKEIQDQAELDHDSTARQHKTHLVGEPTKKTNFK